MADKTLNQFTIATAKPGIHSLVFSRDANLSSPQSRSTAIRLIMETIRDGFTVKSMAVSNPAALSPSDGDAYVVLPTGAGAWSGKNNNIAVYNSTSATWAFSAPSEGWQVYDQNTNVMFRYSGSAWAAETAASIAIADAGSYFTGTDAETALQELGAKWAADLATEGGAGIAGIAETYGSLVYRVGDIYKTEIVIDLTGLNSGGTAGDIIGDDGTGAAYIAQVTAAESGTIFGGRLTCLEAPATGDADIDLYSATEATGVEDTAIGSLTSTQIVNSGTLALGTTAFFSAMPAANQYLYLVGQGTANATYTAGRVLIEMWGT